MFYFISLLIILNYACLKFTSNLPPQEVPELTGLSETLDRIDLILGISGYLPWLAKYVEQVSFDVHYTLFNKSHQP